MNPTRLSLRIGAALAAVICLSLFLAGCADDAQTASYNLSKAADNFEVDRRVVFYNGITDTYMLTIEGRCAIEDQSRQLEVTCKIGDREFTKHFLGLSDNVTYFAEQIGTSDVSVYHHRITFKPQAIVSNVEIRMDGQELLEARPEVRVE